MSMYDVLKDKNGLEWYQKIYGLQILMELQRMLDTKILENAVKVNLMSEKELLTHKFTALSVEVAEWANASRCFKYWSKKPSESKERLIDEAADVLHFFLSICNDMEISAQELYEGYLKKNEENYRRQENGY